MTTILATIVVLGVLILVHELGHFWAAKLVDIEVQRFSIGLGPRIWGFTKGETEYVVSAIPLGGYVKMGGMDDEVMERVEGGTVEKREKSPRDFDAKPLWARTVVISAGVIMNMLFALLLFTFATAVWGIREEATTRVGLVADEGLPEGTEALAGITVGAAIVRIGDREVEHWGHVRDGLLNATPGPLTIVTVDPSASFQVTAPELREDRIRMAISISPWLDAAAGPVEPGGPADKAGIEAGDRFLAVNGSPVASWWDFVSEIRARPGQRVEIDIEREGRRIMRVAELGEVEETDPVTGEAVASGRIGVFAPDSEGVYTPVGLAQAGRIGYRQTVGVTSLILGFLRDLVTGDVSPRSVGSIVTIGQASGQAAERGVVSFLQFMAFFSVNLAVLNLLPIPVLDGGHLLFLAIEGVRGRALSIEQRLRWSNVGFVIILGLMVWALSNDFLRLFGL